MSGSRWWVLIGAILSGLAVGLGVFGTEGLDGLFARKYENLEVQSAGVVVARSQMHLDQFQTAALYQLIHGLALVALGVLPSTRTKTWSCLAGCSFLAGTVLFSGGRYVQTTTGLDWLGVAIPVGAALLIVGWLALGLAALQKTERAVMP